MKCSFCGADNQLDSKVCFNCGKPLVLVGEEVKNEVPNNNISKGKKKGKSSLLISLIIILFIILVVLVVLILNPSPKKVFTNSVDKLYSNFLSSVKGDYESEIMNFEISPKITGSGSTGLEELLGKFKFAMSGGVNVKDEDFSFNYKLTYDDKQMLNVDAQYNDNFYVMLNGLYDKPVLVKNASFNDFYEKENNNTDDVKVVLNAYKNAFSSALKSSYFMTGSENITYKKENVNARVSTLILNNENIKEMSKSINDYLSLDDDFIKSLAKLSNTSEDKIKDSLAKDANANLSSDINVSLYTKKITNEFIKIVIEYDDTKIEFQNKDENGSYLLTASSNGVSVGLSIKYSYAYDEKIELKDVTGAVNSTDVKDELSDSLNKVLDSEGYKAFDNDFKSLTGKSFMDMVNQNLNLNQNVNTSDSLNTTYY